MAYDLSSVGMVMTLISPAIQLHVLLLDFQTGPLAFISDAVELGFIVLYILGSRRLTRRGRTWSKWRSASFISGMVLVFIATGSGLAAYDSDSFQMHVMQHLLLMSFAPFLIALSAPVTLLLQSSNRKIQTRTLAVLHSKPLAVVTFPPLIWILNFATMYVYFLTPIYYLSIQHPLFHDYTHLHFLVTGTLFWMTVIGIDPGHYRVSLAGKFAMLIGGIPFGSFLGISLMSLTHTISPTHTLADVHAGGALLWGFGELTTVAAFIVLGLQWMEKDRRDAERSDRLLDRAALAKEDGENPPLLSTP